MFQHYLITAWRNIVKNGLFSGINIFGLAVGLMSCILIMLFVRAETGYDSWIKDSERVVRLHSAYNIPGRPPFLTVRSAGRMMEAIRDYASNEVEDGVRLIQWELTIQQQADAFPEQVTMADGSFFNVLDLPFVHGDKSSSFNKPFDLVVTEETAQKYFGRTDVIGETMTICCVGDQPTTLPITGVMKDLPQATHFNLHMLVYLQPAIFADNSSLLDTWTSVNVYTYFKLNPGVSVDQLQQRINYWVNNESPFVDIFNQNIGNMPDNSKVTDYLQHKVMPLTDLHLHARNDAGNMGDFSAMGDYKMVVTFIIVAALILLIACINFMNLATARASQRAREVAMRKVLGASRSQVAIQFLSEAVALVFIALLFALVAVEICLPFYNGLLNRDLSLNLLADPQLLLGLMAVALLVGLGAGLYPALYLSRFMPAHILQASKGGESGGSATLRTALVIFQFAISIILVICTIVVYGQTLYANKIDVGYQSDNKLILNVRAAGNNLQSLKQELLNLPEITSVVFSSESPTQDNENNRQFTLIPQTSDSGSGMAAPIQQVLNYYSTDYGFFEAYNISPVAGRLFDQAYGTDKAIQQPDGDNNTGSASVILNESAVRRLGFNQPAQAIGRTLESDLFGNGLHHLTIIGVTPDIYFRSIKFDIRPSVYLLREDRFRVANLSFKTDDLPALVSKVENIWKNQVPMQPISLQFLTEMMAAQYNDDVTTAKMFSAFSLLAIVVACLGLYGLAAFTAERRTREIGIRKVMGAQVRDIVKLLIWQFSKPVFIANLIAWPVGAYAMLNWLQQFPYRIELFWLVPICLATGLLSLLIAWATVGGNAAKVARGNPVNSLRHE
ncbi:ABC transporter permease [Neptunicella sp. SCSIO 80796]|uniref:ABC transporter permease n=1 Tax=Neptunicella plasticusilytica TaxID=3117012 RepID=UPI003A4D8ACD